MAMPEATEVLEFTRRFAAPVDAVFVAFLDPDAIREGWAHEGWITPEAEMDVRVGGRYRFGMREESGGPLMYVHGEYRTIEPPSRLVFTYVWEGGGAGERWRAERLIDVETLVTLRFAAHEAGTELTIRHEGFSTAEGCAAHRLGWGSNWNCLDEYLRGCE